MADTVGTIPDIEITEEDQQSLMEILKVCEDEDQYTRVRMLREAKQNDLYWHGFQYIFWDQNVGDFRVPTHEVMEQLSSNENTQYIYDYVVNIFKAHGLSIIAALSAEVPSVPFSPRDAEKPEDVRAAQKAEQLGKIISKQNKTKLVFYQALFTLYTSHFCAAYNYYERDEKYGVVRTQKYKTDTVKTGIDKYNCPDCPYSTETPLQNCPDCTAPLQLEEGESEEMDVPDGHEEQFKGQEKIRIRGTLNVKLPTYAADQDACGYLIEYCDEHFSHVIDLFPEIDREKIKKSSTDSFEKIARMQSLGRLYTDSYLQSLITLKRLWIRPWMYNIVDKNKAASLKEKFPKGCFLTAIEDTFAQAIHEKLDDHWTITKGDLSRAIHSDPLSKPLLPLQDLENSQVNLMVESLEHSVPSTFADPQILDFQSYASTEVKPGGVYPSKTPINSQKSLKDYFYELKTSTVPAEAIQMNGIIETKSQFVVGAFPSIFGGPQTEGSKTLGEYQESRNYALQRLSIPYQLLYFWYADLIHKCVLDYISCMIEDDNYVSKSQDGNYQNTTFLREEFSEGTFDQLLPESALNLPVSFDQKRSVLSTLVQLNNDMINQFLFSPENRRIIFRFLGLDELSDLDATQATKQLRELDTLITGEPIGNQSSVLIEPEIDDNEIHLRVIRNFLSGNFGQDLKVNNPKGYLNALLHAQAHKQQIIMNAPSQVQQQQPEANNAGSQGPRVTAPTSNGNGGQ